MPELPDEKPKFRFDVATEPWLPIVRDGISDEIGLIEVLCKAHEIAAIRDPMPPIECGLLRLLVAFALDIFQPQNGRDWQDVWREKRFDEARVCKYFEEYSARFNLFDDKHPFLQDANVEGDDKPLTGLLPSLSMTNSDIFFHHLEETDVAVSPEIAARLLSTIACYTIAGGRGWSPSINGAPPYYVLLKGQNLFETIWLNCPALQDLLPTATGKNPPSWRDDRAVIQEERVDASLLEALTWRPKAVRLQARMAQNGVERCSLSDRETSVVIERMKTAYGWKTRFDWRDPHASYRTSKDGTRILRAQEGRATWQDVGAIALLRHDEATGREMVFERPAVVTQFALFTEDGGRLPVNTPLRLSVYSLRTRDAKVLEWQCDDLILPTSLLWRSLFHTVAETEMKRAEDVAGAIRWAIKQAHPRSEKQKLKREDKAFDTLVARAQSQFWQTLRPHYTDDANSLLFRLAKCDPEDEAGIHQVVGDWHKSLAKVARGVLDGAIGELDTDGEAMKRQMEARRTFESRLWALLHPAEAAAAREKKKKEKKDE